MSVAKKQYKRITTKSLVEMKANGEKISMLTAYDYTMAKIVDSFQKVNLRQPENALLLLQQS